MNMIQQFKAARRASAPIVVIRTPDPAETVRNIVTIYTTGVPLATWDVIQGLTAINDVLQLQQIVATLNENENPAVMTGNPVEALRRAAGSLPQRTILFFHNAHFYLERSTSDSHKAVIQAVWNLRDAWKTTEKTLVLLAHDMEVPAELKNDIVTIDEPLPTDKELAAVVVRGLAQAGARKPGKKSLDKMVDAVSGLSSFNAGSVIAMSVDPLSKKIDMDHAWEQKIHIIEQEKGLKVYRHGPTFADIGGNDHIKHLLTKIAKGRKRPTLVVFIDEIEKAMQAAGTDTSGTTTDQLKVLLTEMQNNEWNGVIIYGFPGTGKSELAKAFGNEAGCVTVEADLGAMKNRWVGSSEARMRSFIRVVKAVSGTESRVFFIATCNHVQNLRPEFKRRFRKGIWFCDLPAAKERDIIWKIYFKKFEIKPDEPRPGDEGWTGAEIRVCCENAHEFGISLKEASKFMTLTSQAMGSEVEEMRKAADGKYIDAHNPGVYRFAPKKTKPGLFQSLMMS